MPSHFHKAKYTWKWCAGLRFHLNDLGLLDWSLLPKNYIKIYWENFLTCTTSYTYGAGGHWWRLFNRWPPPASGLEFLTFSLMMSAREANCCTAANAYNFLSSVWGQWWQQFGVIFWPLAVIPKKSDQRISGDRTRDPEFACPNASHCTTYLLHLLVIQTHFPSLRTRGIDWLWNSSLLLLKTVVWVMIIFLLLCGLE